MGFRTKGVVIGDFVTHQIHEGSWMITDIVFNYELNIRQARIIKVGDPKIVDFVEPATLTVIEKKFY
jgi:hypothetical protein